MLDHNAILIDKDRVNISVYTSCFIPSSLYMYVHILYVVPCLTHYMHGLVAWGRKRGILGNKATYKLMYTSHKISQKVIYSFTYMYMYIQHVHVCVHVYEHVHVQATCCVVMSMIHTTCTCMYMVKVQ